MERLPEFHLHPSEEVLEEYWFKRLPEDTVAQVEEHLLVCRKCQDASEEVDDYIRLMKDATAMRQTATETKPAVDGIWDRIGAAVTKPRLAAVLAMLCITVALISIVPERAARSASDTSVRLVALRGGDDSLVNRAPAKRPLNLSIDLSDLSASSAYRVEVVNAAGQRVWDAAVPTANGNLGVRVPKGLNPGVYWVRLYSSTGKLVREFGLLLS